MDNKIKILATELSYDEASYLYEDAYTYTLELATQAGVHSISQARGHLPITSEIGDKIIDLIAEIESQDIVTIYELEDVMKIHNVDLEHIITLAELVPVIQGGTYNTDEIHCALAQMLTGKPWSLYTATGYAKGEWMRLIYADDDIDLIKELEKHLYNKYTWYLVPCDYDDLTIAADSIEELEEAIRAEYPGEKILITLRAISGYQTVPTYEEAILTHGD